jgi:hypothetical protein
MLIDPKLDCRLTDNLNMIQGSKFQAFSLKTCTSTHFSELPSNGPFLFLI